MATHRVPSICIMRAFSTTTYDLVSQTFGYLFGENAVREVRLIPREDRNTGESFWLVFVHFNEVATDSYPDWEKARSYSEKIEADQMVKVEYSAPYYWKTLKCKSTEHVRPVPRIILTDEPASLNLLAQAAEADAVRAVDAVAATVAATRTVQAVLAEVAEAVQGPFDTVREVQAVLVASAEAVQEPFDTVRRVD